MTNGVSAQVHLLECLVGSEAICVMLPVAKQRTRAAEQLEKPHVVSETCGGQVTSEGTGGWSAVLDMKDRTVVLCTDKARIKLTAKSSYRAGLGFY